MKCLNKLKNDGYLQSYKITRDCKYNGHTFDKIELIFSQYNKLVIMALPNQELEMIEVEREPVK